MSAFYTLMGGSARRRILVALFRISRPLRRGPERGMMIGRLDSGAWKDAPICPQFDSPHFYLLKGGVMWHQISSWDWDRIKTISSVLFGASSFLFGLIGIIIGIVKSINYKQLQEAEYMRCWVVASTAHRIMVAITRIRTRGLDKMPSPSKEREAALKEWGNAFGTSRELIKTTLSNLHIQHGVFTEEEIKHFKMTHGKDRYLLEQFEKMMLPPPKKSWWSRVLSFKLSSP
jgi:hypothetical protein